MGKLYDLVKFKNYLKDNLNQFDLQIVLEEKLQFINKSKKIFPEHFEYFDKKINEYTKLTAQNKKIIDEINDELSELNNDIDATADSMFDNDEYREFFGEVHFTNPDAQHELMVSDELQSWINSSITQYSDWHYPALQINPRHKKWIDSMVANDPLYLTHHSLTTIKDMIQAYPSLYQNRLRLYKIVNRNFSKLPQEQFGFVLCWDNFNHLSLDKIEKYIREVWKLLRPGGFFTFSYNNCDLEETVYKVECRGGSYASTRRLTKLFDEIGYEIVELRDIKTEDAFNAYISWATIKKPGNRSTVKASQALAQILTK